MIAALIGVLFSSCLKHDLPDYPAFDNAEITLVNAEHRFEGTDEMWGQPIVKYQRLNVSQNINSDNGIINIDITVPAASGQFTVAERAKVVQTKLWLYVTISTAAKIEPVDGTPALGDALDATKPLKFVVTSAAGTKKNWTINVRSFSNN